MTRRQTGGRIEDMITAALKAVQKGCLVLALHGKVPFRGTRGYKDATTDEAMIRQWYEDHPDANLGIWPGGSGRLVIDIDSEESYQAAETAGLFDLGTPIVITGRNEFSCHVHLKRPEEFEQIGNLTLPNGWEIKCDRAHVVLPPSTHVSTGRQYEWVNEDDELAAVPEEVLVMLRKELKSKSTTVPDLEWAIQEGRRNKDLFDEACRRVRRGESTGEILVVAGDINRTRCEPPLEEAEVRRIVESAERYRAQDAEAFLDSLDFAALSVEDPPERRATIKRLVETVCDWRAGSPSDVDVALVREELIDQLRRLGIRSPAKIWETTDPPVPEPREAEPSEPPPSPEVVAAADKLLRLPDLLEQGVLITDRLGHVGEELNRRVVLLSGVSGVAARSSLDALNLVLRGDSSSGKNELARRVLQLFPGKLVHVLTGMSEQALQYRGEVIRGVLVIQEVEGQKDSVYQIRQAMSEGVLVRWIVQDLKPVELRTELRCSIITTTTSVAVHDENATRVLMLDTDSGEDVTRRVLDTIGREAAGLGQEPVTEGELLMWRTAMSMLEGADVVVPFMPRVAEDFPPHLTRARRDIKKAISMIRACTILHQRTRNKDKQGRLVATVDDYSMVRPLLIHVLSPSMSGISEKAVAIDHAREELRASMGKDGQRVEWINLSDLIRHCEQRRTASAKTVRRWAKYFEERALWERQTVQGNRYQYRSLRPVTDEKIDLPTPNEIEIWMHYDSHSRDDTTNELSERGRADRFGGGDGE